MKVKARKMAESPCRNVLAPSALSYFTATVSAVLSPITIAGNLAVCIAVLKDPYGKLRTPFMYFLVNLSLSDLVVGAITMPTSVATHTMEVVGTKKKVHVDLILITYFISANASLFSLAILCVDRYCAVAHPHKYRRNAKFKYCLIASAIIWTISLSLPLLYFVTGYIPYLMIFAHTGVVGALFILIFSYFKIYKALQSSRLQTRDAAESANKEARSTEAAKRKADRKVTKVFLIILGVFAACYIPVIVIIYTLQLCPHCSCDFRHVLRDLQFILAISNSAMNPFVCTLRLKPFRNALLKILGLGMVESAYTVNQGSLQNDASSVVDNCSKAEKA